MYELVPNRVALRVAAASAYKAPNVQYQFADPGRDLGGPEQHADRDRTPGIQPGALESPSGQLPDHVGEGDRVSVANPDPPHTV